MVYTLQSNGYIAQNPENRRYHPGLQLVERGGVLLDQFEIRKIAMPELERLRDWSSESVSLALLEENQIIYIERLLKTRSNGRRKPGRMSSPLNSPSPLTVSLFGAPSSPRRQTSAVFAIGSTSQTSAVP